jgi:hypothetical protein
VRPARSSPLRYLKTKITVSARLVCAFLTLKHAYAPVSTNLIMAGFVPDALEFLVEGAIAAFQEAQTAFEGVSEILADDTGLLVPPAVTQVAEFETLVTDVNEALATVRNLESSFQLLEGPATGVYDARVVAENLGQVEEAITNASTSWVTNRRVVIPGQPDTTHVLTEEGLRALRVHTNSLYTQLTATMRYWATRLGAVSPNVTGVANSLSVRAPAILQRLSDMRFQLMRSGLSDANPLEIGNVYAGHVISMTRANNIRNFVTGNWNHILAGGSYAATSALWETTYRLQHSPDLLREQQLVAIYRQLISAGPAAAQGQTETLVNGLQQILYEFSSDSITAAAFNAQLRTLLAWAPSHQGTLAFLTLVASVIAAYGTWITKVSASANVNEKLNPKLRGNAQSPNNQKIGAISSPSAFDGGARATLDNTWIFAQTSLSPGSSVSTDLFEHNIYGNAYAVSWWGTKHTPVSFTTYIYNYGFDSTNTEPSILNDNDLILKPGSHLKIDIFYKEVYDRLGGKASSGLRGTLTAAQIADADAYRTVIKGNTKNFGDPKINLRFDNNGGIFSGSAYWTFKEDLSTSETVIGKQGERMVHSTLFFAFTVPPPPSASEQNFTLSNQYGKTTSLSAGDYGVVSDLMSSVYAGVQLPGTDFEQNPDTTSTSRTAILEVKPKTTSGTNTGNTELVYRGKFTIDLIDLDIRNAVMGEPIFCSASVDSYKLKQSNKLYDIRSFAAHPTAAIIPCSSLMRHRVYMTPSNTQFNLEFGTTQYFPYAGPTKTAQLWEVVVKLPYEVTADPIPGAYDPSPPPSPLPSRINRLTEYYSMQNPKPNAVKLYVKDYSSATSTWTDMGRFLSTLEVIPAKEWTKNTTLAESQCSSKGWLKVRFMYNKNQTPDVEKELNTLINSLTTPQFRLEFTNTFKYWRNSLGKDSEDVQNNFVVYLYQHIVYRVGKLSDYVKAEAVSCHQFNNTAAPVPVPIPSPPQLLTRSTKEEDHVDTDGVKSPFFGVRLRGVRGNTLKLCATSVVCEDGKGNCLTLGTRTTDIQSAGCTAAPRGAEVGERRSKRASTLTARAPCLLETARTRAAQCTTSAALRPRKRERVGRRLLDPRDSDDR